MNSIPKQQEGDGSNAAAANGSRGALDQTVLGVAPSSGASVAPEENAGRAAAPEPPVAAPPVIVAAPTIAVSGSQAEPAPARVDDAPAVSSTAPVEIAPARTLTPEPPRVQDDASGSAPVQHSLAATPRYGTPPVENAAEGPQGTVLNADYLRAARELALARPAPTAGEMTAPEATPAGVPPDALRPSAPPADDASASARPSVAPPASTATTGSSTIRGFEPVPAVRAPLAESLSGGLMAVSDLGSRIPPRSTRPLPRPGAGSGRDTKARWMLLLAVAFAAVGVVSFGGRLLSRYRSTTERTRALALEAAPPAPVSSSGSAGAPSQALLTNRPATDRPPIGRTRVVSASGSLATGAAASAGGDARTAGGTDGTTPEAQLAATAARHLLAGNPAEALPVYRQLAREWPENTSYAAMTRLLEKRVGTMNDTRTVAPATP